VELVTIDHFKKLDLRVAKIVAAERVEGTDRLLKLSIDVGSEQRTIVSASPTSERLRTSLAVRLSSWRTSSPPGFVA
jgi:tRNA-binding EMAP/Myf-like protein